MALFGNGFDAAALQNAIQRYRASRQVAPVAPQSPNIAALARARAQQSGKQFGGQGNIPQTPFLAAPTGPAHALTNWGAQPAAPQTADPMMRTYGGVTLSSSQYGPHAHPWA